ncbi:LAQU0S05e02146g1_1 [Lachancea quebecensis]|uniref:LAQU0S05e02146g1_1 n=1 Tax=Lachancea quebecensis TaxID=1654605 RepID=A0A0N7MLH4_9SACH|nr:LAQU0S05e02146g1_1 [Lachancea quebecensis]
MNTPPMGAEKLTPKMSPTMLHLDDGMAPLANPSFMYLDESKSSYPAMYRTSLSKLTERGRSGRGRTVEAKTPTKLLRSNSPIRAMLNNPPKMLKPEYIGISKLLNNNNSSRVGSAVTPSMILTSSRLNFGNTKTASPEEVRQPTQTQDVKNQTAPPPKPQDVKKQTVAAPRTTQLAPQSEVPTLPQATAHPVSQPMPPPSVQPKSQKHSEPAVHSHPSEQTQQQKQRHQSQMLSHKDSRGGKHARGPSSTSTAISGSTACESRTEHAVTLPTPHSVEETAAKTPGYRFPSTTSTASSSSTFDLKEFPEALSLNFEVPNDKEEFVLATQSKRSSYISSIGSANEDDLNGWFAQYAEDRQVSTLSMSDAQKEKALQTEHFSLRVKQLELQIAELRLQNEEMRHNITAHRTIQDRCMFEALHDVQREKENTYKEMDRKMKQLEKQINNYRKVIQKLTNSTKTAPVSKPRIPMLDALTLDEISETRSSDGEEDDQGDDATVISKLNPNERSTSAPQSPRKRAAGFNLSLTFEK